MPIVKNLNLLLRFLLEMAALTSLCYWGFRTNRVMALKIVFGVGIPLLTAFIWGMFGSPKAPYQLSIPLQWLLVSVIYLLSALALYTAGKPSLSIIFILTAVVNSVLMVVWKQ